MPKSVRKPLRKRSLSAILPGSVDSAEFDEDLEIKRLEKLLKINGKRDKKSVAEKLNKEFEEFEGIGENFGEFLMDLDDLADDITKSKNINHKNSTNESDSRDQSNMEPGDSTHGEDDEDEYSHNEDESISQSNIGDDDNNIDSNDSSSLANTYRPVKGEDIYGRIIEAEKNSDTKTTKYIPPARRKLLTPDTDSESAVLLRRSMNGLMNRLSEQSKDTILKSLKLLYDSNSLNLTNQILKECTLTVCGQSDQTMHTLIPVYTAIISALHIIVSKDIGGYIIEHLVVLLINYIDGVNTQKEIQLTEKEHIYITNKKYLNYLMILIYCYNFRIVHHQLLLDLVNYMIGKYPMNPITPNNSNLGEQKAVSMKTSNNDNMNKDRKLLNDQIIELVICIIHHSGYQLRKDDSHGYKGILDQLSLLATTNSSISNSSDTTSSSSIASSNDIVNSDMNIENSGRFKHLVDIIMTNASQSKSTRTNNPLQDHIKQLRKWIATSKIQLTSSSISSAHGQVIGDTCLRLNLHDILNAETSGRWWRTGASWQKQSLITPPNNMNTTTNTTSTPSSINSTRKKGNPGKDEGNSSHVNGDTNNTMLTSSENNLNEEEKLLLSLATKMKLNTPIRKQIFMIIMTSHDVSDAYERLIRLDIKGKEDREIVRVLIECCAYEPTFNAFYSEINILLCSMNRLYKTTTLYAIYDFMKTLEDSSGSNVQKKRIINIAKYLSAMISSFDIPISMIKRVDMASLTSNMILFINTLFISILSSDISEESFEKIFDRVATTQDFLIVRDNIVYFLQTYMKDFSKELVGSLDVSNMKKRKKVILRIMDSMDVLSIAKAQNEAKNKMKD